jgi:hypothetical protein
MAGTIGEVVSISITRETVVVPQAGFGVPLIMGDLAESFNEGYPAAWSTRYVEYNSLAEVVAATFDVTKAIYRAAQELFAQNPRPATIAIGYYDSGAAETMTSGLALVVAQSNAWWGLLVTDRTDANAGDAWEAAQWVQSNKKFLLNANDDTNIKDSAVEATSLAALARANSYDRTSILYHSGAAATTTAAGWPDAAWFGRVLPTDPGSATWAMMPLVGISADDGLTSGERTIIDNKGANFYNTILGTAVTRNGRTALANSYIDLIRFSDWLESDMGGRIFTKMVALDKIPFTDAGVGIVTGAMEDSLKEAVRRGAITDDYTISAPKVKDVSDANKALRNLPDVSFVATGAGAIHGVSITGVIQV